MSEQTPQIDCPLCGDLVRQVASDTLSLALWQHIHWACSSRTATVERLATLIARCEALEQEIAHIRKAQQADKDRFDRDRANFAAGYSLALDDAVTKETP